MTNKVNKELVVVRFIQPQRVFSRLTNQVSPGDTGIDDITILKDRVDIFYTRNSEKKLVSIPIYQIVNIEYRILDK